MILSNLWLLSGAVSSVLSGSYETDAIQRTTTAVTMFNTGFKENVMPSFAEVIFSTSLFNIVVSFETGHCQPQDSSNRDGGRCPGAWQVQSLLCQNDLWSIQGGDWWRQSWDLQKREQLRPTSDISLWQRHHGLPSHCKCCSSGGFHMKLSDQKKTRCSLKAILLLAPS